jgi:energy-coupling factor transport system ATP-binding protein
MTAALQLRDVSFSYGSNPVVRSVSFDMRLGEAVALLGPNGAGKTTITKLIMGLLHPDRGEILVVGVPNMEQAPEEIARDAAYVFQHSDQQLFARTVIEEVSFAPLQLGRSASHARDVAFHALLEVGLESQAEVHPYDLAPTQRKLVALAAALAQQPRLLILDEPTQGLDRSSRDRVCEIVRKAAQARVAVLAVTHDVTFMVEALDRAVVMKEGQVVLDRGLRELVSDEATMRELGLRLPPAAELSLALGLPGNPVRFAGVVEELRRLEGLKD